MKMVDREKIEGTGLTIGRRVTYRGGNSKPVKKYSVEYRDASGKQVCESLDTASKAEARKKSLKIHHELQEGTPRVIDNKLRISDLADGYFDMVQARGLASKTEAKYKTDLDKIKAYCQEAGVILAIRFNRDTFYRYRRWLVDKGYADKTVYGALTLTKQVFKWGYQEGKLRDYPLVNAKVEKARAKPQPCFSTEQVELILNHSSGVEQVAYAVLAYEGLRVGELEQLNWTDVKLDRGSLGMLHICRGGSTAGKTKTGRDRFVPVHPRVRPMLESLQRKRGERLVFPDVAERQLLNRLKQVCKEVGLPDPDSFKLHSFRHHFASMCANHQVAYKKALTWLGHRSSDILDLYYHLSDAESQSAMAQLAEDTPAFSNATQQVDDTDSESEAKCSDGSDALAPSSEGTLRAQGESTIENASEDEWEQSLVKLLDSKAERAGFEPAVRV